MTMLLSIMIIMMALVPAKQAKANEVSLPNKSGATICCMIIDKNCQYGLFPNSKLKNMDVITFTSSNPSVAKTVVSKNYSYQIKGNERKRGAFYLKKPGTTKLTMTYRLNNKIKKMVINLKVIKYTNPLKTFAIGGKNYAKIFNKVTTAGVSYKLIHKAGGTYKFAVKPKKDWKVTSVKVNGSKKQLKNAKKITLFPKGTEIEVKVKYKNMEIANIYALYGDTQ